MMDWIMHYLILRTLLNVSVNFSSNLLSEKKKNPVKVALLTFLVHFKLLATLNEISRPLESWVGGDPKTENFKCHYASWKCHPIQHQCNWPSNQSDQASGLQQCWYFPAYFLLLMPFQAQTQRTSVFLVLKCINVRINHVRCMIDTVPLV